MLFFERFLGKEFYLGRLDFFWEKRKAEFVPVLARRDCAC